MATTYFPWRLFWKFFWTFLALIAVLSLLGLAFGFALFEFSLKVDRPILYIGFLFSFVLLGAAWFSYRFVAPMREVILKALRISSKKYASEFEDEDVLIEQPGEYVELEHALDKIRRKLQKRRLQLAHEREESQVLMSSMDEAIVSVNLEAKIVFFNSRFGAQFLAQRSASSPIPIAQCFREPEVLDLFADVLREGASRSTQVRLMTRLETDQKYFSVRISPLFEEKTRQIYGALAVFHDISEIKKAEQIRIEFVENASHELRTPLTSIKGFVETLRGDLAEGRLSEASKFLGIISKNVDRLTELVNDMLTISSLESKPSLIIEAINPLLLTEDVLARFSSLAAEKRIVVKTKVEVAECRVDALKIEQVLNNLLGNAIKYIQEGGVVEVRWLEGAKGEKILIVKDNGPGIAEEYQGRLFERFFRVDKGRSRDVGGTGLGLSIVKHIMLSHGGTVAVNSRPGEGAEFTCIFPPQP